LVGRLEREVAERWHCALETAKLGVTVNAICPGYVDTELTPRTLDEWPVRLARASRRF
jgi:NAD(P)-dependent dehydrogenase (short-subunit alcohol dehydrogenase family)